MDTFVEQFENDLRHVKSRTVVVEQELKGIDPNDENSSSSLAVLTANHSALKAALKNMKSVQKEAIGMFKNFEAFKNKAIQAKVPADVLSLLSTNAVATSSLINSKGEIIKSTERQLTHINKEISKKKAEINKKSKERSNASLAAPSGQSAPSSAAAESQESSESPKEE